MVDYAQVGPSTTDRGMTDVGEDDIAAFEQMGLSRPKKRGRRAAKCADAPHCCAPTPMSIRFHQ